MPIVSVIIPVYDVERYLGECLDSVLAQTLRNIEIICIDDGSPDRCCEILADYASRDARIKVLTQENAGLSVARNTGMAAATGKYLSFLDSDDCLKPYALESLVGLCERQNLDHIIFAAEVFAEEEVDDYDRWVGYYRHKHAYGDVKPGAECFADLVLNNDYVYAAQLRFSLRSRISREGLTFRPGMIHEDNLFSPLNDLTAERALILDDMPYLFRKRAGSITTGAATPKHAIGYLVSLVQCLRFVRSRTFPERVVLALEKDFNRKYRAACREFAKVTDCNMSQSQWLSCDIAEDLMKTIVVHPWPASEHLRYMQKRVNRPKVSVIIPVHNAQDFLCDCIESVRNQTLHDLEVICVDDGSTDCSLSVLKFFALLDPRIKVLSIANCGGGGARNFALRFAYGKYIAFVDADDWVEPEYLQSLYDKAENEESDLVVSPSKRYDMAERRVVRETRIADSVAQHKGPITAKDFPDQVFLSFGNQPWAKLFRRSFIEERGLAFQELPRANDLRFVSLAKVLARRISCVNKAGYIYREGVPGSSQSTNDDSPSLFIDAWESFVDIAEKCHAMNDQLRVALAVAVTDNFIFTFKRLQSVSARTELFARMKDAAAIFGIDKLPDGAIRDPAKVRYRLALLSADTRHEFERLCEYGPESQL